jgi:hypothetical protein
MVALEMIVRDELRDRQAEVALAERNTLVDTFTFDREHEAFRKCVQVRAVSRVLEAFDTGGAEDRAERLGEQRVAVMNQVAFASQELRSTPRNAAMSSVLMTCPPDSSSPI